MDLLQRLVRPEQVAAALSRSAPRPFIDGDLGLRRAWPLGDSSILVLYAPLAGAGTDEAGGWWNLRPVTERGLPSRYRESVRRGTAILLPDLQSVAERFPDDSGLPCLGDAMDAAASRRRVARRLPADDGAVTRLVIRVAGYKPGTRCMLQYRATFPEGPDLTLWGKCYRGGSDDAAWSVLVAIEREKRCGGTDEPRLAPLRGRDKAARMIFWEHAPGEPLMAFRGPGAERAAAEVGRALAALARLGPSLDRVHRPEDELSALARWVRVASAAFPDRAPVLARAEAAVRRAASRARRGLLGAAHGDFHDAQVRLADDGAVLLDLDTACLAEPELDTGNFLAHLRLRSMQGRCRDADKLAGAFLQSYAEGACAPDPDRLRWYEAGSLLRLACVYSFRPHWRAVSLPLARESVERAEAAAGRRQVLR